MKSKRTRLPAKAFHRNRRICGGAPVFVGTRVTVASFVEWLIAGRSLDAFLARHPRVRRWQVMAVIDTAHAMLVGYAYAS